MNSEQLKRRRKEISVKASLVSLIETLNAYLVVEIFDINVWEVAEDQIRDSYTSSQLQTLHNKVKRLAKKYHKLDNKLS